MQNVKTGEREEQSYGNGSPCLWQAADGDDAALASDDEQRPGQNEND